MVKCVSKGVLPTTMATTPFLPRFSMTFVSSGLSPSKSAVELATDCKTTRIIHSVRVSSGVPALSVINLSFHSGSRVGFSRMASAVNEI